MARSYVRAETSKSHDEPWVVTFADLMALLFCFFVLLTSLSTAPKNCEGLKEYFEANAAFYKDFELRSSKLECVITLPSDALFRSGQDVLQRGALRRLQPLARQIISLPEHQTDLIIVEGHTDDVPIRSRRFASNWELSSARAVNVSNYLRRAGLPEEQLSIRAFADKRPKVEYEDASGKRLRGRALQQARRDNRRVEIILADRPKSLEEYQPLFK